MSTQSEGGNVPDSAAGRPPSQSVLETARHDIPPWRVIARASNRDLNSATCHAGRFSGAPGAPGAWKASSHSLCGLGARSGGGVPFGKRQQARGEQGAGAASAARQAADASKEEIARGAFFEVGRHEQALTTRVTLLKERASRGGFRRGSV